jgi:hypothetical protein
MRNCGMAQAPKRIPGARNPTHDGDAPMHVARESWMGGHGYGITSAIIALFDWRKRRKGRTVAESINHDA